MKIRFLNGGLANQVFQYIFARHYELLHPEQTMYLDDSYFALNTVHNYYELEKMLGIKPYFISKCFDEDVWQYMLEEKKVGKSTPQILNNNGIEVYMISEVEDGYKEFNSFQKYVVKIPVNLYEPNIQEFVENVYYHVYGVNKDCLKHTKKNFWKNLSFQY